MQGQDKEMDLVYIQIQRSRRRPPDGDRRISSLNCPLTARSETYMKPNHQFWISCQKDFPQLAAKAMMSLLPFATTYLCESGFVSLTYLKDKYRSRLQPEAAMPLPDNLHTSKVRQVVCYSSGSDISLIWE